MNNTKIGDVFDISPISLIGNGSGSYLVGDSPRIINKVLDEDIITITVEESNLTGDCIIKVKKEFKTDSKKLLNKLFAEEIVGLTLGELRNKKIQ